MSAPEVSRVGSKGLALAAMLFAVSMTFIDQTIIAIASPNIQAELDLSRGETQWIVNAYLLALAATFAVGGRMADVYGPRKMALIGIVGFAGSSIMCGLTPKGGLAETWIVLFRVTQGISGALMIPAALAVVVSSFPIHERGKALAIFFGVTGAFTAVGPIAGGYLTQWTWRAIFWVNVPIAILALVLTVAAKISTPGRREPIDWPGAALVASGMALSVLGFEQAPSWGWGNIGTWVCIIGGFAILAVFVRYELRTEHPLLKLRIFRDRAFVVDNAVLFFSMIAFVPVFFFASVYAQVSLAYDANNAGLYLFLFFGGFAPAAQIGGRLLDARGAKGTIVLGCALAAIGFAWWGVQVTDLSLGSQWYTILIAGAGIGFLLGPASTDAVNRAIGASYGEVTGIGQTLRNYGSSLGIAVLGTILTSAYGDRLTNSLVRQGVPRGTARSIAVNSGASGGGASARAGGGAVSESVRNAITASVRSDFAYGIRYVLFGMAVALIIAFLIALMHPGDRVRETESGPVEQPAPAA
jgi:EmrB/QacA subfamily drug resistance transporter